MPPLRLRWTLVLLGLLIPAGCRCGVDTDSEEEPSLTQTKPSIRMMPPAEGVKTTLVVAEVQALEAADLSAVVSLDLAMSEVDSDERLLDLTPREEPSETTSDDDPSREPALAHPRCEGLDLHSLAQRAPMLRSLRISGCQAAVHAGLSAFGERLEALELVDLELDAVTVARLSQLHGLDQLTLTRVHAEPDVLKPLGRKISPQSITLRELAKDSPVAQIFGVLRDIREIRIVGAWPTHKTMIQVAKAARLERLAMIDTEVGNYSLRLLQSHDHLMRIEWRGPGLNGLTPIYLKEVPITQFVCDCARFGDNALRQLYLFEDLQVLVLDRSAISSAGLVHLVPLQALEDVTIRYVDLDADAFTSLAQLPRLQRLVIGPGALEDPQATGLGELVHLRQLEIELSGFGDAAAPQLATLVALERLGLGGSTISDAGLEHLAPLTALRELELHHTRVTKHGLQHLAGMRSLEVLELDHTDVVDEGVAHLANLSALRELRLDHTLITDAAIPSLVGLSALEQLNLAQTVVTAEGVTALAELPALRSVNLADTRALEN